MDIHSSSIEDDDETCFNYGPAKLQASNPPEHGHLMTTQQNDAADATDNDDESGFYHQSEYSL